MNFLKTLCALALLSATTGLQALKVSADSPIYICTNKGLRQGSPEFEQCVAEQKALQSQKSHSAINTPEPKKKKRPALFSSGINFNQSQNQ